MVLVYSAWVTSMLKPHVERFEALCFTVFVSFEIRGTRFADRQSVIFYYQ